MTKLMGDLSDVINYLETLKLLDRKNFYTELSRCQETNKRSLKVTLFVENPEYLSLCLEMFQELRDRKGHAMVVLANDCVSSLSVEFEMRNARRYF